MLYQSGRFCLLTIFLISSILVISSCSQLSNSNATYNDNQDSIKIVRIEKFEASNLGAVSPVLSSSPLTTPAATNSSNPRADLVTFTNVTPSLGLSGVTGDFFAWGDYNNDGNEDLLVNGGRLFKNNGPPKYSFTEVTSAVGLSGSGNGAWADYDNDGYLDFYCAGSDKLWHNTGPTNYAFKDVTTIAGNIRDEYPTTAVGWGDYDLDGYLDLYIACGEDFEQGIYYPDFLYHNNGDGTFTNVTNQSGIRNFGGPFYGRGVSWGDYDNDGWPDIYISNYRISQNWLFHNNRNGTFIDVALEKGVAGEETQWLGSTYYGHTIGSAWADLDNDGDLDLFESNLVHKDLYRGQFCGDSQIYRNDGSGSQYSFTNVRSDSGVPEKDVGGGEDELYDGIAMGDFNNDGYIDFFIPQVYDLEYSYSYLYLNNGDWTFTNVSDEVGVMVWSTYGGAWCDYNNDGFLDLVTGGRGSANVSVSKEVHLYESSGNYNSWLHIQLKGYHYNRQGIGVRVKVSTQGPTAYSQIREVEGGMGCHSMQNSIPLEFGFGSYFQDVNVEVHWPSGIVQKIEDVQLNQLLIIEETTLVPDMTFINYKVLEQNPIQGDSITLEASVANMGNMDVERALVSFYDGHPALDGIEIGVPQEVHDLKKFHSAKVNTTWDTTGFSGEHELWAVIEDVEPGELVISNNTMNYSINIRDSNELPVARFTATPTDDLDPGDNVLFDASNSTDDIEVEYYYFDFGDGNNSDWITNMKITHQYMTPGEFTAKLLVKDSDGAISTNNPIIKLTISELPTPNQAPIIDSFNANPIELGPGETSNLKVTAHDPDGDALKYYFFASSGTLSSKEYKSTANWEAPNEEGTYTISAKVYDDDLFSITESVDIKVIIEKENQIPVINDIYFDETVVYPEDIVNITVQAYDPDHGDNLSYSYEASDGEIVGSGPEVTWRAPETPGKYYITVTVTDLGGLSIEQQISIEVIERSYTPEILYAEVNPAIIGNDVATEVLFTVELNDKNGLFDIERVTIDLSSLGGISSQKMFDNGKHGDVDREDGTYSFEYLVSEGMSSGTKILEITATDYSENEVTYDLILEIESKSSAGEKEPSFIPGFDLNIAIISIVVIIFYFLMIEPKKR